MAAAAATGTAATGTVGFDDDCDYLVIGGGATGMAFSDSLLKHHSDKGIRVVVVDAHETPGGQWHDSYRFVRLHQPSDGYGVESIELSPSAAAEGERHRATRTELLEYYETVRRDLESNHEFAFLGGHTFALEQLDETDDDDNNDDDDDKPRDYVVTDGTTGTEKTIRVRKKVVDARNLEPDLPVSTPPKFGYDPTRLSVVPVNDLFDRNADEIGDRNNYVVIGGGKTGMDAVHHLLETQRVSPDRILWVVPNDAWITARENIGNCIDFLHAAAKLHDDDDNDVRAAAAAASGVDDEKKEPDAIAAQQQAAAEEDRGVEPERGRGIGPDFFQRAFLEWETLGRVYRLDPTVLPAKFKDATLSGSELAVLRGVRSGIVRRGRIASIANDGDLVFADGTSLKLPFSEPEKTLFVHCSAGAFHCSRSRRRNDKNSDVVPIFGKRVVTVKDVYGTPGFCFVGSLLGKLESLDERVFSDDDKNAMALAPPPPDGDEAREAVSGGDVVVGRFGADHPYVSRARNLSSWLSVPELRDFVTTNRLFHLRGADPTVLEDRLDAIFRILRKNGISVEPAASPFKIKD